MLASGHLSAYFHLYRQPSEQTLDLTYLLFVLNTTLPHRLQQQLFYLQADYLKHSY